MTVCKLNGISVVELVWKTFLIIDIVDDDQIVVLAGLIWAIRDTAGEVFVSIPILSNQVWFDGSDDDLCIGGYDLHG